MILCPISFEICFTFEFQGNKLKRSTGPSSLTCFHARGKKTKPSNNLKTSFSSSSLTQSLSGLKCALASFFKPSHRCGGETTKSNSVSYRTFLAYLFPCSGEKPPLEVPHFLISKLGVKRSPGPSLTFLFQDERLKTST